MADINELRIFAKEITESCEKRKYSIAEVDLLVKVLKDEVSQCKKAEKNKSFKALT